jgi:hypothetical protein
MAAYQIVVTPEVASVSKGNSQQFYAVSSATGEVSGVTWTVTDNVGSGTSWITSTGLLYVAAGESASTLTVTAAVSGIISAPVTVTVVDYVVTMSPNEATIRRGDATALFSASATIGGVSTAGPWDWSIIGSSGGSSIQAQGNDGALTVETGEEATMLTVVATLWENPQIKGTAVVKIPTVTGVTVEPATARVYRGNDMSFNKSVTGVALETNDEYVEWEVKDSGGYAVDSYISEENGVFVLHVHANETAEMLTVTATSSVDTTKSGTAVVRIPTVTGVTVSTAVSGVTSFVRGGTVHFSAEATGFALEPDDKDVDWEVSGSTNPGTWIDDTGFLTVATDETAATLTVKGMSGYDNTKYGTVTLSVELAASVTQNGATSFYATLQDAITGVTGGSVEYPVEITVSADVTVDTPISIAGADKHIKLVPAGGTRTIIRGGTDDSLFTLSGGASLELAGGDGGEELIIDGGKEFGKDDSYPLVKVDIGTLTMGENVVLQNNNMTGTGQRGGGVHLAGTSTVESAKFIMNGGIIRGNIGTSDAGGVYLYGNAKFIMNGGSIEDNQSSSGGGVDLGSMGSGGNNLFQFTGGYIQNNTATHDSWAIGGGITVDNGIVEMSGTAVIRGNKALGTNNYNDPIGPATGGGVGVKGGTFEMQGGEIRENSAAGSGGGVYVRSGTFTKTGGTIYGSDGEDDEKNIAGGDGPALYREGGTVTINGDTFTGYEDNTIE